MIPQVAKQRRSVAVFFLITTASIGIGQEADQEAVAVVKKAIAAHGGRDKLVQLERTYVRTKVKSEDGTSFLMETWKELDREKTIARVDSDPKRTIIRVTTPTGSWEKFDDGDARLLSAEEHMEAVELLRLSRVVLIYPLLEDKDIRLTSRGEFRVGKETADCVRVKAERAEMDLYFNKTTGLLIKRSGTALGGLRGKPFDAFYEQYKDLNGFKRPVVHRVTVEGKPFGEHELIEFRAIREFPLGTFSKP